MKGNFEDNNQQVRHLMEAIGGSADAYEERRSMEPTGKPVPQKPNPFESPDNAPDPLGALVGDDPTPEDEMLAGEKEEFECLTGVENSFHFDPAPLEGYEHFATVARCGELDTIWRGFVTAKATNQAQPIAIDSGQARIEREVNNLWSLKDPAKNRQYLQEGGNLAGHLSSGEILIWVTSLEDDQELGYIHSGYVYLPSPSAP